MNEILQNLPDLSDNRTVNSPAPAKPRERSYAEPPITDQANSEVNSRSNDTRPETIDDLDEKDYAEACHLTAVKNALASLKHDITSAQNRITNRDAPVPEGDGTKIDREWKSFSAFQKVKLTLTRRVLKKCLSDVLEKEIVEKLEKSGAFDLTSE